MPAAPRRPRHKADSGGYSRCSRGHVRDSLPGLIPAVTVTGAAGPPHTRSSRRARPVRALCRCEASGRLTPTRRDPADHPSAQDQPVVRPEPYIETLSSGMAGHRFSLLGPRAGAQIVRICVPWSARGSRAQRRVGARLLDTRGVVDGPTVAGFAPYGDHVACMNMRMLLHHERALSALAPACKSPPSPVLPWPGRRGGSRR
jgi:hypothetical protein